MRPGLEGREGHYSRAGVGLDTDVVRGGPDSNAGRRRRASGITTGGGALQ